MTTIYASGALHWVLSPAIYIWLLALMVAGNTALVTLTGDASAEEPDTRTVAS